MLADIKEPHLEFEGGGSYSLHTALKLGNHCSRAYNQREKLEDSFILDLAKRLSFEAKQRYLDYLFDRYGGTNEPTYQNLVEFVKREELFKSTDFAIMLLGESQSH